MPGMDRPPSASDGSRCSRPRSACQVTHRKLVLGSRRDGTAQDRFPSPSKAVTTTEKRSRRSRGPRSLGFDSVWMEEHHSVANHYWPRRRWWCSAGFATRTSRLTLGTDILVAAFHHPVRLAEDVALLDVMSGGALHDGDRHRLQARRVRPVRGVPLEARGRGSRSSSRSSRRSGPRIGSASTARTTRSTDASSPSRSPSPTRPSGSVAGGTSPSGAPPRSADNWIPGPTADLKRLLDGKKRFLEESAPRAGQRADHRSGR